MIEFFQLSYLLEMIFCSLFSFGFPFSLLCMQCEEKHTNRNQKKPFTCHCRRQLNGKPIYRKHFDEFNFHICVNGVCVVMWYFVFVFTTNLTHHRFSETIKSNKQIYIVYINP